MALGINYDTQAGDIQPIIKYDSRSGRLSRIDRINNENTPVDITRNFKAVFDLENVETGFIAFNAGAAPGFSLTRLADGKQAVRPSDDYKPGVRVLVKLHKDCGGDIREIAGNAKAFLRGIDELHNAYVEGLKTNPGKLPIVILKDTVAVTSGEGAKKSTNYSPVFEIVGWAARPQDLVYTPKTSSAPAPAHGAPHTGSTQVGAPAATAASADGGDFG